MVVQVYKIPNLKGLKNCVIGSKDTEILLDGWNSLLSTGLPRLVSGEALVLDARTSSRANTYVTKAVITHYIRGFLGFTEYNFNHNKLEQIRWFCFIGFVSDHQSSEPQPYWNKIMIRLFIVVKKVNYLSDWLKNSLQNTTNKKT